MTPGATIIDVGSVASKFRSMKGTTCSARAANFAKDVPTLTWPRKRRQLALIGPPLATLSRRTRADPKRSSANFAAWGPLRSRDTVRGSVAAWKPSPRRATPRAVSLRYARTPRTRGRDPEAVAAPNAFAAGHQQPPSSPAARARTSQQQPARPRDRTQPTYDKTRRQT